MPSASGPMVYTIYAMIVAILSNYIHIYNGITIHVHVLKPNVYTYMKYSVCINLLQYPLQKNQHYATCSDTSCLTFKTTGKAFVLSSTSIETAMCWKPYGRNGETTQRPAAGRC